MDDKGDLIAFARESATSGVDLYELLGADTTTSREDIHRAWRRQGLKYHPDKAGANFDASLYERFARARDVLVDEAAREVYDAGRAAAAQRKMQSEQMTAERRRFKDELEAAERATRDGGVGGVGGEAPFANKASSGPTVLSSEREKLREAGRRRAEERQRQEKEAQERQRQREDERIAELERLLREKQERAQRRAEKKAARSGSATESTTATVTAKKGERPPAEETADRSATTTTQPDPEWRNLLSSGRAQAAKKAEGGIEVTQRPIFAYTMERLRAAGEAQRQRQAKAAGVGTTPAFEPQWQEIDDPQVRKFIKRVPRF